VNGYLKTTNDVGGQGTSERVQTREPVVTERHGESSTVVEVSRNYPLICSPGRFASGRTWQLSRELLPAATRRENQELKTDAPSGHGLAAALGFMRQASPPPSSSKGKP
jgi:hypothetical protein